jgi:hypothetical protein
MTFPDGVSDMNNLKAGPPQSPESAGNETPVEEGNKLGKTR